MAREPFDPPYTSEDVPQLDKLHYAVGIGEEWLNSEKREELLKTVPLTIERGSKKLTIGTAIVHDDGKVDLQILDSSYHYLFADETGAFSFGFKMPRGGGK